MMFDGSTFYGIDDTGVRDDAPADTVFTHYLVSNLRYIEKSYDRAGAGVLLRSDDPVSGAGVRTGRIFSNVGQMSIRVVPMYFDRVPRRVNVDIWVPFINVAAKFSARLELEEYGVVESFAGTPGRGRVRLTLELPDLTRQQSGVLYISMQSIDITRIAGQAGITQAFAESETIVNISPDKEYDATAVGGFPFWVGAQATGRDSALAYSACDHVLALSDTQMAVTGQNAYSSVGGVGGLTAVYNISAVQVGSYQVSVDYSDDYFDDFELRANIPEFSDLNRRIAAIQARQYERPVLLSTGTQGDYRIAGDWPSDYRSEWRYADGDAVTPVELFRQSFDYVEGLTALEVYPGFMGVHLIDPPFEERESAPSFDKIWEQRSIARWKLTLTVEQYADASSTPVEVDTLTRSIGIAHLPCANLIETPALHQAYLQRFDDAAVDYHFTYTEGQMQPADFAAVVDQVLQIAVDDTLLDADKPFDLVLSAEIDTDLTPHYGSVPFRGWGGSTKVPLDEYELPEFLRLQLMYFSIYGRRV